MTQEEIEKILRKRKPTGRDIAKLQIHDIVNLQKIDDGEPPEEIQPQIPIEKLARVKQRFFKLKDAQELEDYRYTCDVINKLLSNLNFCKAKYMQLLKCLEQRKTEIINIVSAFDFYQVLSMLEPQKREEAISKSLYCHNLLDHTHIINRLTALWNTQEDYLDAYYYLKNWNSLVQLIASEREIEDLNYYQLTDFWIQKSDKLNEEANEIIRKCRTCKPRLQDEKTEEEVIKMLNSLDWQDGKQLKTVKRMYERSKQIVEQKQIRECDPAFFLMYRIDPNDF